MQILNYYRGSTDRLSGFAFDTEKKAYKEFSLSANDWVTFKRYKQHLISEPKEGFKQPCDIGYFFQTRRELDEKLHDLIVLGFKEDESMVLDFGVLKI